jgi:hypothetical protein
MQQTTFFAAIALIVIMASSVVAQEANRRVRIRNWEFEWKVVESGSVSFRIVKTDDALYTRITAGLTGMNSIRLTPEQSVRIAPLLWDAGKQLRVLKGVAEQKNEAARKKVDIEGKIEVLYVYDPDQGGRVYVSEEQSFILGVGFNVSEAETLAGKMEQAAALCKVVDTKVRPND